MAPFRPSHVSDSVDLTDDEDGLINQAAKLSIKDEPDEIKNFILVDDDDEEDDDEDDDEDFEELDDCQFSTATISAIPRGFHCQRSVQTDFGVEVVPGSNVELNDGSFLRVKRIIANNVTSEIMLRGILLYRSRDHHVVHMRDMLPKTKNELCVMLHSVNPKDADPRLEDHMVDRPINSITCLRIVIFTNKPFGGPLSARNFDDLSFRDDVTSQVPRHIDEEGILVARWKSVQFAGYNGEKAYDGTLMRLRESEADPGKGIPDAALVHWWREEESKGGTPCAIPPGHVHDLTSDDVSHYHEDIFQPTKEEVLYRRNGRIRKKQGATTDEISQTKSTKRKATPAATNALEPRTLFDFCAGAGGMTTGISMAKSARGRKFVVKYLLDEWVEAYKCLRRAFPGARTMRKEIHDFCTEYDDGTSYKVIVAQLSFPCQTYSSAHTWEGKNDDKNRETGYSVIPILRKTRARHVTLEQTFGMVRQKHKNAGAFSILVHQLTAAQYSVRWKVVNCADHGNAHARKRLIVFASCPGEPIATFAPRRPGPRTTIGDVLSSIPLPEETEAHMRKFVVRRGAPHDSNKPLGGAITCGGLAVHDLHPSGKRGYTLQELAQLAGFPWWRLFAAAGPSILRRLIGNAVPSEMAKDQYLQVHNSLDKGDAEMAAWLATANLDYSREQTWAGPRDRKRAAGSHGDYGMMTDTRPRSKKPMRSRSREQQEQQTQGPIVLDDEGDESEIITIDD